MVNSYFTFYRNFIAKASLAFLVLLMAAGSVAAQTVTGKVTDKKGNPLPGASIVLKGTQQGTVSDMEGRYTIKVPGKKDTLIFSYVGFDTREIAVKNRQKINVKLSSSTALEEVVVTALGVEREEKALGYAVTALKGEQISQVKTNNVTDQLAGKAPGVYVTSSSSGPTASTNINIRGAASLLGNNQPLFVVNGMPITNDLYSFDDGLNGSTTIDFGNAAQIVNPDDIASINILKGPAASALYGARAADGVILIETKTGENAEGWGIEVNNSLTFEDILKLPDYQNTYGFGGGGKYSYLDGSNYIGSGGYEYYEAYGENWGPEMNGQLIKQFNSNGEPVPFTPAPDNVRNFFRTGITNIVNVAVNNNTEDGDFRLSYTNLTNQGIVPNTDLKRNTLYTSVGKELFEDKLSIRLNAMYVNSASGNVPNAGYDESSSVMYGWLWYPRQVEINDLRQYWQPGLEGIQQRYVEDLWVNNPWLVAMENTNSFQSHRLIGNLKVRYDLNDNFYARFRYGADVVNDQRQYRRAPSTKGVLLGSYREDDIAFTETNAEVLVGYSTTRSDEKALAADFKLGGNIMRQNANFLVANNPQLKFFGTSPSVYTLANARSGVLTESQKTRTGINSLFGIATLSYKYFLYLDLTYRQDWSSTLVNPIAGLEGSNFSFGYPSASLSAIISEMTDLGDAITFLKLRANYAEVGNGAPAYAFGATYTPQPSFGSQSIFTTNRTIADPDLTNERTRAYEGGIDLRMFDNRLRFDATYYSMRSFNQVITLPVAASSGYDFTLTNGGIIANRGVELFISGTPVESNNFRWDVTLNVGHNRAIVEELPDVIESGRFSIVADLFPGDEGGADLEFVAEEGKLLGQLYGLGFVRHPETNEIIHQDGLPMITEEKVSAGSYQPDMRLGLYNAFSFGQWNVAFLIDGQIGGKIYSRSHALYNTGGTITNNNDPHLNMSTLDGRTVYSVDYDDNGNPVYTLQQEGGVVGPGLMWEDLNGDGEINYDSELSPNTVEVEPGGAGYTGYFYNYYGNGFNRDNIEAATYDATYFKLREVTIGYTFPDKWLKKSGIAGARVSLIGRNLLLFTNVPTIDPETYSIRNGLIVPGYESTQLPSTRSIGLLVNLKF